MSMPCNICVRNSDLSQRKGSCTSHLKMGFLLLLANKTLGWPYGPKAPDIAERYRALGPKLD
jgi:hypothetical protein